MQRVHQGEQLHVHFIGTNGSGKHWAKDTLYEAAMQQGLHTYFLRPIIRLKRTTFGTYSRSFPLDCMQYWFRNPKTGYPTCRNPIKWLSLSQLRRSLFSHAPKTPDLTHESTMVTSTNRRYSCFYSYQC